MKKFIAGLFLVLLTVPAHAGIIAVNTISADATIGGINDNFQVLKNVINGQIQGSATTGSSTNILAASIGYLDMGAEANPVTRDSELLGIGVDTTTSQASFVYTGLTPATSATLTSNVSAGTAYISGYRVVKVATSQTYAASMDTYLDLSYTGVYTQSAVSVGGTAPSVAPSSARLAKVTTSGTAITSVTDLANRRIPGLIVPTNYRVGLLVSRDSTATVTILPGVCEVNGTMVSKTTTTTLNLGTAGHWAGGSSLRAVSTYGYVGTDASGNVLLYTTAPTNDNYSLTTTLGKKRYASWASTTYRILGWFYMNATGAGELNTYEVGNIKEGDTPNYTGNFSSAQVSSASQTFVSDTNAVSHFYSSGNPTQFLYNVAMATGGTGNGFATVSIDSAGTALNWAQIVGSSNSTDYKSAVVTESRVTLSQGTHTVQGQYRGGGDTIYVNTRNVICQEQ